MRRLTKEEYYSVKNIPFPKTVKRLEPQLSYKTHLLQPLSPIDGLIERIKS